VSEWVAVFCSGGDRFLGVGCRKKGKKKGEVKTGKVVDPFRGLSGRTVNFVLQIHMEWVRLAYNRVRRPGETAPHSVRPRDSES
jgi:hypothetical protein